MPGAIPPASCCYTWACHPHVGMGLPYGWRRVALADLTHWNGSSLPRRRHGVFSLRRWDLVLSFRDREPLPAEHAQVSPDMRPRLT
jgi:hypothetical protein